MGTVNRVFYIEDNQANRSLMVTIFERYLADVELTVCPSGTDALKMLSTVMPRLILLDGHLGDMTAAMFVDRLKTMSVSVPPIIVVSGSLPADIAISIDGVLAHVMKPFMIRELVDRVSAVLQQGEADTPFD